MERVCKKTEFEVEGWRKIPPLLDILENNNIPTDVQQKMELKMIQKDPIFEQSVYAEAFKSRDLSKLKILDSLKNPDFAEQTPEQTAGKSIKHSWIYEHFKNNSTRKTKIALYVNAVIPINENLRPNDLNETHLINNVGNHCVVVSGLSNKNGKECLELENNGGCEETRFIPVDFPFYEEIQIEVNKINDKFQKNKGIERYESAMNKLGKKWAEEKWGKIENNWFALKKEPKESQKKVGVESRPKYEMLFVRGRFPCFQLKFIS